MADPMSTTRRNTIRQRAESAVNRTDLELLERVCLEDVPALLEQLDEMDRLRATLAALRPAPETVTEYGVLAWSKHLGKHHVDACDDYATALSTLRITWRKVDAGAQLMSRQVAAPGPVGEWRAVSPDDAAVAFETAKAGAQ